MRCSTGWHRERDASSIHLGCGPSPGGLTERFGSTLVFLRESLIGDLSSSDCGVVSSCRRDRSTTVAPKYFDAVGLARAETGEWLIEIGPSTTAVPYGFMIGPDGAFGIAATRWVPLHASIEVWIASLALAHEAFADAGQITRFSPSGAA
jgi:hypothetical protein